MATLEGEALLLGIWKNVQELEESLNLSELELIVKAARDKEHRHNKFMAAIQGIDIDKGNADEAKERFERVQRRVRAKQSGKSEDELMLGDLGFDVAID